MCFLSGENIHVFLPPFSWHSSVRLYSRPSNCLFQMETFLHCFAQSTHSVQLAQCGIAFLPQQAPLSLGSPSPLPCSFHAHCETSVGYAFPPQQLPLSDGNHSPLPCSIDAHFETSVVMHSRSNNCLFEMETLLHCLARSTRIVK